MKKLKIYLPYSTILLIAVFALVSLSSCQQVTTGQHIIKIQTATGFDQKSGVVQGQGDTFRTGETLYIVFTVKTDDEKAQVTLKVFQGKELEDTSLPVVIQKGEHIYSQTITLNSTGKNTVEIDYNGVSEGSIVFNVV